MSCWALELYVRNGSLCLFTLYSSGILILCNEVGFGGQCLFWILLSCLFHGYVSGSVNGTSSWISWWVLPSTYNVIAFGFSSACHFNLFRVFLTSSSALCWCCPVPPWMIVMLSKFWWAVHGALQILPSSHTSSFYSHFY